MDAQDVPSPAATNTAHQVVEVSSQVEVPVEATALLARPRTSGVPIKAAARRPAPVRKTRAARKSKPLKEFTIFEKLPFELRIMIMVLALPDPIIHEVRVHEKFEKFIYPENWPPARHGFPATNRHPALLRVNKEFRTFALKHYTPLLSRHPIVTGLGKKLYPSAGIDQLNYPDGTIVTEDMPEIGNYCDLSGPLPNPFPTRGVLLKAHKRSYVDVERDTLYFNETTFKGNTTVRNLKGVRQINREVQVEDSCNVKHVAIDYAMWKGTPKYHYGWWKAPPGATILEPHLLLNEHGFTGRYIYPPHINEVDLNLGYLFEGGAFAALTTLTLVICDYRNGRTRVWSDKEKYLNGPITFSESADLGPELRRKGGRQRGPWASVVEMCFDRVPNVPDSPAAVLAQIEVAKADIAAQVAELRVQKPEAHIPEIKWAFALRNGKFRLF
ncbi:hypothetical protein DL95DRAFT_412090 [Leptodontidium sp. 2 PMI_412]|nr:hypothetical protein DL95DRAFT_412090 [Leptodontidium sp. 2 PMI_412]